MMMGVCLENKYNEMKKLLILILLIVCSSLHGQTKKFTDYPVVSSATSSSLLLIRSGAAGNVISTITKGNILSGLIAAADTASMLSKYSRLLSPQLLGVPRIGTDTIATKAYARSVGGGTGNMSYTDTASMLSPYARKLNPVFLGVQKVSTTDTLATKAYARLAGAVASGAILLKDSVNYLNGYMSRMDGVAGLALKVNISDTASMLASYINRADTGMMLVNYTRFSEVRAIINDSLDARIGSVVLLADSILYPSGYMSRYDGVTGLALKINLADSVNYANGYMSRMDGVAGLALKVNIADTATMLVPYIERKDTATMLTNYIERKDTATMLTNYLNIADSVSNVRGYASRYDLTTGLGTKADTAGQVEITDVAVMLADMKSTLVFGVGSGDAADTTLLSTTRKYGSLYWGGNLTFHCDTMIVQLMAGAGLDTISVQINWSDTLSAVVPTVINTTALAIGRISGINVARTIEQFDYSFNNATIPPGKHVWMSLPYIPAVGLKRKPTMVSITLIGHLQ